MIPYRHDQRFLGFGIGRPFGRPFIGPLPFLTGLAGGLALGALARPPYYYPPYPYYPYPVPPYPYY
ncbi:hypothetical protein ACFSCX_03095 [Bacillus salitolerans]|uniref:Spore coat protein n=1 Tax=Bacillus salitolerans TaxID=1437434 RepID=A0ABW4LK12_9BACI